jgi:hypothetical protein
MPAIISIVGPAEILGSNRALVSLTEFPRIGLADAEIIK